MAFHELAVDFARLETPLPVHYGAVGAECWVELARAVAQAGDEILALWGDARETGRVVLAAYRTTEGILVAELALADGESYPDLARYLPAASRMQRAAADLVGVAAADAEDRRPWLRHEAWPANFLPLGPGCSGEEGGTTAAVAPYPFVEVVGDGVHEIPVGPVHAGIIEPGHFRFSVVGEKVLRLEARLGYTHKGVERRFVGRAPADGAPVAGRISGDSTVAYAWAYAMAVEAAARTAVPDRAVWLRAVLLERERVANHLGDLGALGNDAALGFALTQFSLLREQWQRASHAAFGHRLLMDTVVPGGVARDPSSADIAALRNQHALCRGELRALQKIFEEHAGLQDRFVTTGRVSNETARRLGLTGMAGRASGVARDLRSDFPLPPYDGLECACITQRNGDVAARVNQRFAEAFESLRLLDALLADLPGGDVATAVSRAPAAFGLGCVEGWRGPVMVALRTDDEGRIARCHCHDPSWQNWPVLEHAVIGNIVADFPLINKSFNLSYSGQDL